MSSYNENHEYTCEFCSRAFKSRQARNAHNGCCLDNPNRTRIVRWKPKPKPRPKCTPQTIQKIQERLKGVCKFCEKSFGHVKYHEKLCRLNPNRVIRHITYDDNFRKRQSEIMRERIKNGTFHGWVDRHSSKRSYPEIMFRKMIDNHFVDKEVTEQLVVGCYRIDFAWRHKMRCIEIDGSQHEQYTEQIESDKRKDAYLTSHGWTILRIRWLDLYNDPKAVLDRANTFITEGKIVPYNLRWMSKKEKNLIRVREKYGDNPRRLPDGRIYSGPSETEWSERWKKISSYDKTVPGWMKKATKETGLTKGIITSTCKHFGIEYRTAKHTAENNWRSLRKDPASQLDLFYN